MWGVRTVGLVRLEVLHREPYEAGSAFGDVGPYERIDAVAHYAVDADAPLRTRTSSAWTRPPVTVTAGCASPATSSCCGRSSAGAANRVGLVEVPNRGRRVMTGLFNRAVPDMPPQRRIPVGDGFLMRHGFSLVWCGWQWDVPRGEDRMGLDAPRVLGADGQPATAWMQLRFQLPDDVASVPLTDQHVGPIGNHEPIPTADVDDTDATLYVRDGLHVGAVGGAA